MQRNPHAVSAGGSTLTLCALLNAIFLEQAYTGHPDHYKLVLLTLPILLCLLSILRNRARTTSAQIFPQLKSFLP